MNLREIGLKVGQRRTDLGLSQARLAKLCGLSRSTIHHLEKGSLNDLGAAAGNDLTLCAGDLVNLGVVRPGQKKPHHQDAAPRTQVQHEGGFALWLVVGVNFILTAHIQVA